MASSDLHKCPTCGSFCLIGGDDEGTHYFVPQESDFVKEIGSLRGRNEKLVEVLKLFQDSLAIASLNAEPKTMDSYLVWIKVIGNALASNDPEQEPTEPALALAKAAPSLLKALEGHCSKCCGCCDHLKNPNADCMFGRTLRKARGEAIDV